MNPSVSHQPQLCGLGNHGTETDDVRQGMADVPGTAHQRIRIQHKQIRRRVEQDDGHQQTDAETLERMNMREQQQQHA